jgi:hypothetical protein
VKWEAEGLPKQRVELLATMRAFDSYIAENRPKIASKKAKQPSSSAPGGKKVKKAFKMMKYRSTTRRV